jgi:hypothetical protein
MVVRFHPGPLGAVAESYRRNVVRTALVFAGSNPAGPHRIFQCMGRRMNMDTTESIFVSIKIHRGLVDEVRVFTDKPQAQNWEREVITSTMDDTVKAVASVLDNAGFMEYVDELDDENYFSEADDSLDTFHFVRQEDGSWKETWE